jgi:hypothetical protein
MTCGKLVIMSAEKFGCTNIDKLLSAAGLRIGTLR